MVWGGVAAYAVHDAFAIEKLCWATLTEALVTS